MTETEETKTNVINEILNAGARPFDRTIYMAWMHGYLEELPKDIDVVLPGIFKMVSNGDRIEPVEVRAKIVLLRSRRVSRIGP